MPWPDADKRTGHPIEEIGAMYLDLDPNCIGHQHGLKITQQVQCFQFVQMDQGTGIADNELDDGPILVHASPSRRLRG